MSEVSSALIEADQLKQITELDDKVRLSQKEMIEAEAANQPMLKALVQAKATQLIRNQLGPLMGDIKALMNTPMGFKTDRDPLRSRKEIKPYSDNVVRDVVAVALLDGAMMVGNEFNIISGQYYRTLEQLRRRINEFPGLKKFRFELGVPVNKGGGALVPCWATWEQNGVPDRLDCLEKPATETEPGTDTRIPVRVNEGMLVDAILGKARRKLFYRVLEVLHGRNLEEDERTEPEDTDTIDVEASTVTETVETADASGDEANQGEAPTDDDQSKEALNLIWQRFEKCTQKTEAKKYHDELIASGDFDETQQEILKNFLGDTLQRISNTRGPRSKPQEKKPETQEA